MEENALENVVCEMASILSPPHYVNRHDFNFTRHLILGHNHTKFDKYWWLMHGIKMESFIKIFFELKQCIYVSTYPIAIFIISWSKET